MIRISKQPIFEGCYCMWAGGEGSLDAWTAALAARLQLDSPHASRQPSVSSDLDPHTAPSSALWHSCLVTHARCSPHTLHHHLPPWTYVRSFGGFV